MRDVGVVRAVSGQKLIGIALEKWLTGIVGKTIFSASRDHTHKDWGPEPQPDRGGKRRESPGGTGAATKRGGN
jgi:hypothetical protein